MDSAEANLQTHIRSFHLVQVLLRYKLNYTAENGLPMPGIGSCANKVRLMGPAGVRGYRFPDAGWGPEPNPPVLPQSLRP